MIMRKKKGPSDSSSSSAPPPNPEMLDREVYDEGPGYAPPPPTVDQGAVNAGLAKLNEADPDFSEKEFLDKVQTAFYINQKAWTERNLEIARGYLSDGLYNRFKMQIDELIRNRRINVLENIVIGGVKIVEVKQEAGFDSIRVRIRASMTDYTIDEQSKSIVQGSKEPYGFTEYWSFIRRIGERTPGRKGEGYKSNSCPGCGAPLQISQSGNCDFCGAQVSSSLFDWVLDTITQEGAED
jgi:predicted lipid-binding transport protein (Tim44 family)